MVVAYVQGLQWGTNTSATSSKTASTTGGAGGTHGFLKASATCKHFAAYSLEEFEGMTRMGFDAVLDPRCTATCLLCTVRGQPCMQ